ncbi:YbhB/YbcL family Raf kinase inhibitor-like protein [Calidithermus chliarophilus]|uniref:YbhB/YbcL family Raf kinase inhibitor-like protein n=1 Tax=Calidithermus chliarophilus TaxID=52023 RepID=UPI0004074688|nr:YbhB/YbcL family Raf kinase inhibitor-like protein [Calidithermus chliarophilus]
MFKPLGFGLLALLALGVAQTSFTLTSPDIPAGSTIKAEQVYNGFGCSGQNVSPALQWSGAPADTKSFALIVHDPDAPTGVGGFTHWIVYNIPANVSRLEKGAGNPEGRGLPAGAVQAVTSFGTPGWGGPCPPAGDKPHRYEFTLYALKVDKLELPASASQALVGFNINGNAIAKASFTAVYGR